MVMLSVHDAAVLNRFYDALNEGDVDAVLEVCDTDVEVYMPPNVVAAIAPRGHREVGDYLRGWFDSWHVYRPEPEDFVDAGDQIVALVKLRARGKGSRFEISEPIADVFEVEQGKIAKLRLYVPRETALEQVPTG